MIDFFWNVGLKSILVSIVVVAVLFLSGNIPKDENRLSTVFGIFILITIVGLVIGSIFFYCVVRV